MRHFILPTVVVCLLAAGCGDQESSTAASKSKAAGEDSASGLHVAPPLMHENLTIFPVVSRVSKTADRFITLDEGLQAGSVEILEMNAAAVTPNDDPFGERDPTEQNSVDVAQAAPRQAVSPFLNLGGQMAGMGVGNEVNRLVVINNSDKPLYLMPGEVIIGGDQDRTIGSELVIPSGGKPMPIDVFCVEHGRWGRRSTAETVALLGDENMNQEGANGSGYLSLVVSQSQSLETSAQEAGRGKFVGSAGHLSKKARLAVVAARSQEQVWSEVGKMNALNNVQPASGAFTANYADAQALAWSLMLKSFMVWRRTLRMSSASLL